MTADQRDLELLARLGELTEQRAHHLLVRRAGWQQQRGQEPAGTGPAHRDVVGVDVQRVPAQLVSGEGDRIGGGHEIAIAEVDDGGVLAHPRPHEHPRIMARVLVENGLQQIGRQLAGGQKRHRAP